MLFSVAVCSFILHMYYGVLQFCISYYRLVAMSSISIVFFLFSFAKCYLQVRNYYWLLADPIGRPYSNVVRTIAAAKNGRDHLTMVAI
jgi:hypothetical protein